MSLLSNCKCFFTYKQQGKKREDPELIENSSRFPVSDYFLYLFKTTIVCWLRVARKYVLIYFVNDSIVLVCSEIRTLSQTKAVQPSTNRTLGYASEARARILQSLPKENVSQPLPIKKKKFWKKKFIKTAYPLQHQHHGTHIQRSQNKFSVPVHDYFHPSSLFAFLRTWKCMYAIVFVHLQISHRLFFHIAHKHNHSQKVLKPDCCYAVRQL